MSLPGHDPTCTVIHTSKGRSHYTCLNCIQAGYARADERQRILLALSDYLGEPDSNTKYSDWELGWRKGIRGAIAFIETGGKKSLL